ncbi:MAG: M23 family metallopeptidase [Geminicoccaceae bacterium]
MTRLISRCFKTLSLLCFLASGQMACASVDSGNKTTGEKITGEAVLKSESGETISLLRNPTKVGVLTSQFGIREHPLTGMVQPHRGIDFGVAAGTPILAASNGILTFRGVQGSYGNLIKIRHSSDIETVYAHLSDFAPGLGAGMYVRKGEVIGYVGSTGRSTGPHLHYEMYFGGERIDPLGHDLATAPSLFDIEVEVAASTGNTLLQ